MKEMNLPPPEFTQKRSQIGNALVRVTLKNNYKQRRKWIDRDVSKVVGEAIASRFTEREIRVVNWAAEHSIITISDANKLLNVSWDTAQKILLRSCGQGCSAIHTLSAIQEGHTRPEGVLSLTKR